MKLVITEKPSVAQSYASVLGVKNKKDGYLEGNGYLISWCCGHLLHLADAAQYEEKYAHWRVEDLPILPQKWAFVPYEDKRKQIKILSDLMCRDDVDGIINGCDAGREGELIFREVYENAKCKKLMMRLWLSSMEDRAIKAAFSNLKDGKEYENLYTAALCRTKADWLVGINATRYFTLKCNTQILKIGRVLSPTLSMLVNRAADIETFEPKPFYMVETDCGFSAISERFEKKDDAEAIAQRYKSGTVTVTSVESKEKTEKAPQLYDLTSLQRAANQQYGFTAKQTLDYLQSLYEKKLVTYPRTDSRYLTDDMAEGVPVYVDVASKILFGEKKKGDIPIHTKQICNSARVSDHHALLPTLAAGKQDLNALLVGERTILQMLSVRVLMAVGTPYCYKETIIILDDIFTSKGRTTVNSGWKTFLDTAKDEAILPSVKEGDILTISASKVKEGKTTPPKPYTEDTLLSAMERAGAEDMPEDAERQGIGTPATRADMIEKMLSVGFAKREKNGKTVYLLPTETGKNLITILPETLKSAKLTAEWEQKLQDIEHGILGEDEFMKEIGIMMKDMIQGYKIPCGMEHIFPYRTKVYSEKDVVGKCPRCQSAVIERQKGFFCSNTECKFALWKADRFFSAKQKKQTADIVRRLLDGKRVRLEGCVSEKKGTVYHAWISLKDDGSKTSYTMDFELPELLH